MTKAITGVIMTVGALTIGAVIGLGIGKVLSTGINKAIKEIKKR